MKRKVNMLWIWHYSICWFKENFALSIRLFKFQMNEVSTWYCEGNENPDIMPDFEKFFYHGRQLLKEFVPFSRKKLLLVAKHLIQFRINSQKIIILIKDRSLSWVAIKWRKTQYITMAFKPNFKSEIRKKTSEVADDSHEHPEGRSLTSDWCVNSFIMVVYENIFSRPLDRKFWLLS